MPIGNFMRVFCLLASVLSACPAIAQDGPLNGKSFAETVTGKTYDFAVGGQTYGREQYLPGNRVIWDTLVSETCKFGTWYEAEGSICFLYEDAPDLPKCWTIFSKFQGSHQAFFDNEGTRFQPYKMTETSKPLTCTGPYVGS